MSERTELAPPVCSGPISLDTDMTSSLSSAASTDQEPQAVSPRSPPSLCLQASFLCGGTLRTFCLQISSRRRSLLRRRWISLIFVGWLQHYRAPYGDTS